MSMMASGAPGYTTHPAPNVVGEALLALNAAPNLYTAIEQYLSNPATPPAVRRMIAAILYYGDLLAAKAVAQ